MEQPATARQPAGWWWSLLAVAGASVFFNTAYSTRFSFLILGFVACLLVLAQLLKIRFAFYAGIAAGLLCFAPQLWFFWGIFHQLAIILWVVLAFWMALFVALSSAAIRRLGMARAVWLLPFLWTGIEYFRSELYYLRFTWLNVGYAFANSTPDVPFSLLGVYGIGFAAVFLIG